MACKSPYRLFVVRHMFIGVLGAVAETHGWETKFQWCLHGVYLLTDREIVEWVSGCSLSRQLYPGNFPWYYFEVTILSSWICSLCPMGSNRHWWGASLTLPWQSPWWVKLTLFEPSCPFYLRVRGIKHMGQASSTLNTGWRILNGFFGMGGSRFWNRAANAQWKPPWFGLVLACCGGCTTSRLKGIRCCDSNMAKCWEWRYNHSPRWTFSSTLLVSSMWSCGGGGSDGFPCSIFKGWRVEVSRGWWEPSLVPRLNGSSWVGCWVVFVFVLLGMFCLRNVPSF